MEVMHTEGPAMDYGSFLRDAREARGLNRAQLAAKLDGVPGCKQSHLYDMERGATVPNRIQEEHIADALALTQAERTTWTELIKLGEAASMRRKSEATVAAWAGRRRAEAEDEPAATPSRAPTEAV